MQTVVQFRFALLSIALAAPFLGCAQWQENLNAFREPGEIRGQIEFFAGAPISTEKEILVFLEPIAKTLPSNTRRPVQEVEVQTARNSPAIRLVTVDQPIRIRNLDSYHHELFTTNTKSPLRIRLAGRSDSDVFRLIDPGLIRFYCVLHPDEIHTFIAITNSTYHTFVDSNMHFRIPQIRPGRYRVRAASALDWGQPEIVEITTAQMVRLTLRLMSENSR